MITSIEHVGIAAMDTKALKDFYVDMFGWEVAYDNGKSPATYFVKLPEGDMIEIFPASGPVDPHDRNRQGICHIALWTDDFQNDVKKITDRNLTIVDPPKTSDKGVSTVFFLDPEGNVLHYIQRKTKL